MCRLLFVVISHLHVHLSSLFPFPALSLLHLFVDLRVIGELDSFLQSPCSHSLTCCLIDRVLVCTHWAFDYRHPPPSTSFGFTHLNTYTHTHIPPKSHLCIVRTNAKYFFSCDSCDFCLLTKTLKETRQGSIIPLLLYIHKDIESCTLYRAAYKYINTSICTENTQLHPQIIAICTL